MKKSLDFGWGIFYISKAREFIDGTMKGGRMKTEILEFLKLQPNSYFTEIWEDLGKPNLTELREAVIELESDGKILVDYRNLPLRYRLSAD